MISFQFRAALLLPGTNTRQAKSLHEKEHGWHLLSPFSAFSPSQLTEVSGTNSVEIGERRGRQSMKILDWCC